MKTQNNNIYEILTIKDIVENTTAGTNFLTKEDIGKILKVSKNLTSWLKEVEKTALLLLQNGETIAGFKLDKGRTTRVIQNEKEAISKLKELGYKEEEITNTKIKGIIELESLVGGKNKLMNILEGEIVYKEGNPVVVEDDGIKIIEVKQEQEQEQKTSKPLTFNDIL